VIEMGFRIWKHQDSGDPARIEVYVMVDNIHDPNLDLHIFQAILETTPFGMEEFQEKVVNNNLNSVILSVSDFPKLAKEIRQAAKEIREEAKP
jgi:hypothetical protein